jgi:hypothetical protein
MLISKKRTCLSDKMPPKKVKINKRKKTRLSKIRKQFFNFNIFGISKIRKLFFNFNFFWGGILSLRQVRFFEISIKFSIF